MERGEAPSRREAERAAERKTFEEHRAEGPQAVACCVLTVSDTREAATDTSGALIRNMLEEAGHRVSFYRIVKDEPARIREALLEACGTPRFRW